MECCRLFPNKAHARGHSGRTRHGDFTEVRSARCCTLWWTRLSRESNPRCVAKDSNPRSAARRRLPLLVSVRSPRASTHVERQYARLSVMMREARPRFALRRPIRFSKSPEMKKAAEVRDLGGFSAKNAKKNARGIALQRATIRRRRGHDLAAHGITDGLRYEEHRERGCLTLCFWTVKQQDLKHPR